MSLILKNTIHQYCLSRIQEGITSVKKAIEAAELAKRNDTKSSAGDKFETGREMMQAEIQKHQIQLAKTIQTKTILNSINPNKICSSIEKGSLVFTNQGSFYIAIGIGKVEVKEQIYYVISLQSPIGQVLNGLSKADQCTFRGKKIVIEEVV